MDIITQNLNAIIGVVVGLIALWVLYRILGPKKTVIAEEYKVNVQCRKCKWQGTVTKYNQTCRKCASKDLDAL